MATYTSNYNLTKPTMAESADIRVINGNMDTVDEIMHSTQVSMADAFDSTATYAIRDVVMYEFELYQCIHPHTGEWDANDFVRVNAAEVGGNYVEITPTYNTGLKVADTNIDGDQDEIKVPYMTGATAQADGAGGLVPAPTMQDVGKYLKSDGTWETPSGGGGGTTVVPNPVGEPTDELETVQIGNTIFSIPGSGGGAGSGYSETTLYSGSSTQSTYQLTDDISNYDLIWIGFERSSNFETSIIYPSSYLLDAITSQNKIGAATDDKYSFFTVTSETLLTRQNEDDLHIVMVKGIKYGGGGNTAEVLPITAGDGTTSRTFTFSKAPKFLKIYWEDTTLDGGWTLDTEIAWGQPYANYKAHTRAVSITGLTGGLLGLTYGADGKSVTITSGNALGAMNTANGSGLMFVDYGDRGASGGYSETDLFVNSGSTNPSTIVMAESIQNYDEIVFFVTRNAYGNTYKLQFRYTTSGLTLGDVIQCWCWGPNNEYFSYELTDYDTLDNMAQGNALLCTKIIGIKH